MNNGTTFKIGDYNLKMNNNSSKKNFRTTFQEQFIQKKINNLESKMCFDS